MKRLSFLLIAGAFVAAALGATATRELTPTADKVNIAYALVNPGGKIRELRRARLTVRHPAVGVYCLTTAFPADDVVVPVSTAIDLTPAGNETRRLVPSSLATAVWRVHPTKACTRRAIMQAGTGVVEVDTYKCGPHSCLPKDSAFMVNPTG
jgi:hypothetical protein